MKKTPVAPSRAWFWWIGGSLFFIVLWNILALSNPAYSSERLLWPAQVAAMRISKTPNAFPPASVQKTISKLQRVIQRYPGSSSAAQAQLLIGGVYAARKEYPPSREVFEKVVVDYPNMTNRGIEAYGAIATTYLAEKQWGKALETYRKILTKYPMNMRAMNVPETMVAVARSKTPDISDAVLREAVQYYRHAIDQSKKGSGLSLVAQQQLAKCYLLDSRWKEAAQIYETLAMTYFNRREVPLWVKAVEELGKKRLENPELGRNLALRFAEQYPQRRQRVEPWLKK